MSQSFEEFPASFDVFKGGQMQTYDTQIAYLL